VILPFSSRTACPMCSSSAASSPKNMDTEQVERLAVEPQLQAPFGVTRDLAARDFAVISHADFVGHVFVR